MSDYGTRARESVERQVELRLKRTYTEAQKDILKKLDEFTSKYKLKDRIKRKQVEDGEISEDDYKRWLAGQVFMGAQWEEKVKDITDTLTDIRKDDLKMIHDREIDVFATNANYQQYKLEHDIGKNFGFDLYDEDAVRNLIEKKPALLPEKIVDKKKHNHWNQGIIANSVTQGIIQGESIPKIAARIANTTANHNLKASTLYARTAMTCAQNSGRMEMLRQSKEMGIDVKKKWLATRDKRTRDSHIHLDGQVAEVEKPFKSDFGNIDFPGDPKAHPGDVYNCRCTLVYVYPEYENYGKDELPEFEPFQEAKNMTYEEWEESHKESYDPWFDTSDLDITVRGSKDYTQEDINEAMSLAGADFLHPTENDYIRIRMGDNVAVKIETDEMEVSVVWNKKDNFLYIDDVFVTNKGRGAGTEWMEDVVKRSKQAGLDEISLYAVRSDVGDRTNGYYSWARMGFDGELSDEQKKLAEQYGFKVTKVSELMKTEKGRAYWKEHGTGLPLSMKLDKDSEELKNFNLYIKDKFKSSSSEKKEKKEEKSRIKNITEKYQKKQSDGKVTFDDGYKNKKRNEPERKTAKLLSDKIGGNIRVRIESNIEGVKTPDYEWNGKDWDLKSTTTTKASKSAIKSGLKQIRENPGGIILNYKDNEFDLDEVEQTMDRLLENYDQTVEVIVISKDEVVLAKKYKNKK